MKETLIFERSNNNLALKISDKEYSYQDLRKRIQMKKTFIRTKLDHKIISAHRAQHSIDFIVTFIAFLELGRSQVILSSDWSDTYIEKICTKIGKYYLHSFDTSKFKIINETQKSLHNINTSVILFTSGSTGDAKGVELSLLNITSNIKSICDTLDFDTAPSQVLFLPLSYSFGLIGQLCTGLNSGQTIQLVNGLLDCKNLLDKDPTVSMISGVPEHYNTLSRLGSIYPDVTHVISAGGPLSLELRKKLIDIFPNATLYNNYGQTELGPRALSINSKNPLFFSDCTGYPIGDLQIKLDSNNNLMFKGSHVMLGYLGEKGQSINDGWLNTFDKASIKSKAVYIEGRSDLLIKIDGERIHPQEIQDQIEHIDEVNDACVLAITSKLGDNILCAIFTLKTNSELTVKDIRQYLSKALPSKKIPKILILAPNIPKSSNGKIDYQAIRVLFKERI
jgi:long-chain acyl-CoA synthetase